MEEKILEALNQRFPGADAKTLGRIAKKLAKTTTEEADVQTAVDGVTFQQVMDNYGDARATEATKTAITNYEKQHALKDGKPIEGGGGEPGAGGGGDEPEWAKQMRADQEALRKELAGYRAKEVNASRKAQVDALLKDVPESVRKMYEGNYARMTFESDEQFNAWMAEAKPQVETVVKEYGARGAVMHQPRNGKTERQPGEADPLVVARAERVQKQAEAAPSAIIGAPAK